MSLLKWVLSKIAGFLTVFGAGVGYAYHKATHKALLASEERRRIDAEVRALSDADLRDRLLNDPAMRGGKPD